MGRHKGYDPEVITDKAMELFWLNGYHGTSTQDLVEHLKINRNSLYAEFGSKQSLYEKALTRYEREMVTSNIGALESADAGIAEIGALLKAFAANARTANSKRGCLMCNTAAELAPHNPNSQRFVEANVERIASAFTNALKRAQRRGEVRAEIRCTEEGRYLAVTLFGFFVMLRAQIEPKVLRGAANAALRYLEGLRS